MAVALGHHIAVYLVGQCALGHIRALGAQSHGATQVGAGVALLHGAIGVLPFVDQRDHRVWCLRVKLGAVGAFQARFVARVFDGGHLHAQANAQVRHLVLTGVARRTNLAFHTALAKAARHQNGVEWAQHCTHVVGCDGFGVDVGDLRLHMVLHAGVAQRFVERFVAVAQVHILAHHGDLHRALRVQHLMHQIVPALEVGRRRVQAQLVANQAVESLLVQHAWHFVDGVHVPHADHAPFGHVGEQRNLVALFVRNRSVCAAEQHVGLNTDFAQLLCGVLGGFGLEFAGGRDPRHIRQVHKRRVARAHAQAHLAHRL